MDRVRLGRALGRGARAAARTAVEVAGAATATPPESKRSLNNEPAPQARARSGTVLPPLRTVAGSAGRAAAGMATPLRKASTALWHEVTGCFFALFALSFAMGAWHTRAKATSIVHADRYRFYAFCALALIFVYFSASNFLRARRR